MSCSNAASSCGLFRRFCRNVRIVPEPIDATNEAASAWLAPAAARPATNLTRMFFMASARVIRAALFFRGLGLGDGLDLLTRGGTGTPPQREQMRTIREQTASRLAQPE